MGSQQQATVASFVTAAAPGAPLPAGTIILFDRGAGPSGVDVPSGWTQYVDESGALGGFMIKGGSTVSREAGTAGTLETSFSPGMATAGSHAFTTFQRPSRPGTGSLQPSNIAAGEHTHPVSLVPGVFPLAYPALAPQPGSPAENAPTSLGVQGAQISLIRTASEAAGIPAGGIVFTASTIPEGFTRKTWGEIGYPAPENGVYSISADRTQYPPSPRQILIRGSGFAPGPSATEIFAVSGSAGSHGHEGTTLLGPSPSGPTKPVGTSGGAHVHNIGFSDAPPTGEFNVNVWQQFKHLLPMVTDSPKGAVSGTIVMFNGVSTPSGWKICDGTNSTPNMVDYFLGYDNVEDNTDVLIGRDTVGKTFSKATTPAPSPGNYPSSPYGVSTLDSGSPGTHTHQGGPGRSAGARAMQHPNDSWPHSHTVNELSFLFPDSFVPAHITLIFIQKE
jgi:hypothetical protein